MDVLVIGGGGMLGSLVCRELERRGQRAIPLGRRDGDLRDANVIARAGASLIVNCAGASVALGLGRGWRGYGAVDVPIGLAAIEAAKRTNARLVYVAVHHPPALRGTAYVDAHERVADAMRDVDGCVVRATGFYSAYTALLPMAQKGLLFDIGSGRTRTNPICERDLAEIIVELSLDPKGPRELAAGGPQVMTRRQILEQVASAARRPVRIRGLPVWLARINGALVRVAHPRIGQFLQFAVGLARHDAIAPALGTTTFAQYLGALPAAA